MIIYLQFENINKFYDSRFSPNNNNINNNIICNSFKIILVVTITAI